MLTVKTCAQALEIIKHSFAPLKKAETVPLSEALGRTLLADVEATEYVPDFDRSTVDGYALSARNTFGASDSSPVIFTQSAQVKMGSAPDFSIVGDACAYIPTGGALPPGADAVVMLEYTENFGGDIGVNRPVAPGENVIFRGDDVFPGKTVLKAGRVIRPADIGALAALGIVSVCVAKRPRVAIISTGDELVPAEAAPQIGQVRDVNSQLLSAQISAFGGEALPCGIVPDGGESLESSIKSAIASCDCLIISGGSSVGVMDVTSRIIGDLGELLFHGILMKPGKPTILGKISGKPVFGLPGNPGAAYFVAEAFVKPLIKLLMGQSSSDPFIHAKLAEKVSANHGRTVYMAVTLEKGESGAVARPVRAGSGLIATLAGHDGYIIIPAECEGIARGGEVLVYLN